MINKISSSSQWYRRDLKFKNPMVKSMGYTVLNIILKALPNKNIAKAEREIDFYSIYNLVLHSEGKEQ